MWNLACRSPLHPDHLPRRQRWRRDASPKEAQRRRFGPRDQHGGSRMEL